MPGKRQTLSKGTQAGIQGVGQESSPMFKSLSRADRRSDQTLWRTSCETKGPACRAGCRCQCASRSGLREADAAYLANTF